MLFPIGGVSLMVNLSIIIIDKLVRLPSWVLRR